MSKLDDVLEEHSDKITYGAYKIKRDVKELMRELIPEPIGQDGIHNYDEPTYSILWDIIEDIEKL